MEDKNNRDKLSETPAENELFFYDPDDDYDREKIINDNPSIVFKESLEDGEDGGETTERRKRSRKLSSAEEKENKGTNPVIREIFDWAEIFVMALVCVILTFTFLFRYVVVDGTSMYDTLNNKDGLIISNLNYTPKDGDIVVVKVAEHKDPLIKRVIATEGETIDIDFATWKVTVTAKDGTQKVLDEPYVTRAFGEMINKNGQKYPFTVSENHIFVMGDNRNNSDDSRSYHIGEIDTHYVIGRVLVRVYPFDKIGRSGLYIGSENPNYA